MSDETNQRKSTRGGDNYFGGDFQQWIIGEINNHAAQIRELTYRLDNLPNRVITLENQAERQADKTSAQGERVKKLEELEVVIRPEEVLIRPLPPHASDISPRALLLSAIVVGALVLAAVLYLIHLQGL